MSIQPFDSSQYRDMPVHENCDAVLLYARYAALIPVADAVWAAATVQDRRAVLQYLFDMAEHGRGRFYALRELLEEFGTAEKFLEQAQEDNFDFHVSMELHPWIALFVEDRQGVNKARFSTEAFLRNYGTAQERGR